MSKIWIFGDSYAASYDNDSILSKQQWHKILASELGMDMENYAKSSTGLDYNIYYQWHQVQDYIDSGDLIVATLTAMHRRWLLKDSPETSTLSMLESLYHRRKVDLDSKLHKALQRYFVYLDHGSCDAVYFRNWLYSVDAVIRDRGCRVLLIPCFNCIKSIMSLEANRFPNISMVLDRSLFEISDAEHVPALRSKLVRDGRLNHFLPPNHRVLVDKILNWYNNNMPVTLQDGFNESIIDGSNLKDQSRFIYQHILRTF